MTRAMTRAMTPAELEVLQMRLDGIARGMQETLFRTAVSPIVCEGYDAACALFTADGELLAPSDAIPLLLGALPRGPLPRSCRRIRQRRWRPASCSS